MKQSPLFLPDSEDLARIAEATRRASASGQTRWVAAAVPAVGLDPLRAYARAGAADRFYWERAESGACFSAWGVADEIESTGLGRTEDVADWAERVRDRLVRVGHARQETAPLLLGGFAFEAEDPAVRDDDWKAFPSARFFLPSALVEQTAAGERLVAIERAEPGVTVDEVLARLEVRLREALARAVDAGPDDRLADVSALPLDAEAEAISGLTPDPDSGPAYRVRADRSHARFEAQVRNALDEIGSGRLEKVVLARSLRVDHDGRSLRVPEFLERLRRLYPSCTLIAIGRGHDTFLAATPEPLVRVSGRRLETAALAGSAPRGRTPEEDQALGAELVESAKERAEHAHVVDAIRTALEPFCTFLGPEAPPRLRRLFGIQHLETPIEGVLEASRPDVLRVVAALHPTPAVGGVPAAAARAWIRRIEGLDRGWYAAPLGWLDAIGGGDFCVALRSALIREQRDDGELPATQSRARLFAGAGLVAGSEPGRELDETRTKLRALLAPLTEI